MKCLFLTGVKNCLILRHCVDLDWLLASIISWMTDIGLLLPLVRKELNSPSVENPKMETVGNDTMIKIPAHGI